MTTKTKIIVGAVAAVAAALLAWQLLKKGGDGSKTPDAAKTISATKQTTSGGGSAANADGPPARLKGKVSIKGSGEPVAAVVQISPIERGKPTMVVADADGRYAFADLEPGRYRVSASFRGYLPALSDPIELDAGADGTIDLEVEKGGSEVTGQISDISGGPVSGAFVRLTPIAGILDARPDRAFSTITNAEGRFTTTAADGVYSLSAHHPDYVPRARRVEIRGGSGDLLLSLVPGGTVEGVVLWAGTREPVAGATIRYRRETIARGFAGGMRQMRDSGRVDADERGAFRITGAGAGLLSLTAESSSAASDGETIVPIGIAETVTGVEIFVTNAFAASGRVVDGKGEPVKGIMVTLRGGSGFDATESADDGTFRFAPILTGKYVLNTGRPMMGPGDGTAVEIKDKDVTGIELVAESATLMIRGFVEPATDAEVSVAFDKPSASMSFIGGARTDDGGKFELGPVTAGATIPLRAVSADGRLGEVEVKVGKDGADNVVIKLSEAASISGRVVDQDGKPVVSATVSLRVKRAGSSRMVMINGAEVSARRGVSDPQGNFEVRGLEAGDYQVLVKNDRGQTMLWAKPSKGDLASAPIDISVAEREAKSGVTLTVEADNAEIRGRVLGPDGRPAADVFVTASPSFSFHGPRPSEPAPRQADDGDDGDAEPRERSETVMVMQTSDDDDDGALGGAGGFSLEQPPVVTDDNGRFVISGLRRGDYDLVAEGMRGTARALATKVKTGSDVSLKLQPLTALEGVVTRDDKPIKDFSIELSGPTRFARSYSDEQGRFTIRRLDPGSYKVIATGGGGETEMEVEVLAGEATKVEIKLQGQVAVTGRLVDEAGAPKPGVLVLLTPRRNDGEVEIRMGGGAPPPRTKEDGSFEISSLPGPFTFIALAPGIGPLAMKPVDVEGDTNLGDIVAKEADTPPPPSP